MARTTTTAKRRAAKKGITIVNDTPQFTRSDPIQFSDLSRELAWKRLWDEVYAELLPVVVEMCHEERQAA